MERVSAGYLSPLGRLLTDELDLRTDKMIEGLASGPQTAIRYKKTLNSWLELDNSIALQEGLAIEGAGQQPPDHEEAIEVFLDGRRLDIPRVRSTGG